MNKLIIKGRLTADPELKTTSSGVSFCKMTVAVNRNFAKQGEERQADFFRVNCWRQTAEFVSKHFTKGQEILLEGAIESNKFTDKDGNNRISWEVTADRVEFCGSKSSGTSAGSGNVVSLNEKGEVTSAEFEEVPLQDGELPF